MVLMNEYSQALHYIMLDFHSDLKYGKQISTLQRLVDKSEAKELQRVDIRGNHYYLCPTCGNEVTIEKYCPNCGQHLKGI